MFRIGELLGLTWDCVDVSEKSLAEGKPCDARDFGNVAAQVAHQVAAGVVRFANHHEVEARFHLHGFERLCGGVRAHNGDLHVRKRLFDGADDLEVVQNTRRTRAANDECRVKLLDAVQGLFKVQLHGGAVYQLDFVTVRLDCAGGVT